MVCSKSKTCLGSLQIEMQFCLIQRINKLHGGSPEPNLRFISCLSAYNVISLLERAHAILYFPGNHGCYWSRWDFIDHHYCKVHLRISNFSAYHWPCIILKISHLNEHVWIHSFSENHGFISVRYSSRQVFAILWASCIHSSPSNEICGMRFSSAYQSNDLSLLLLGHYLDQKGIACIIVYKG
jgi:hypothetical protein